MGTLLKGLGYYNYPSIISLYSLMMFAVPYMLPKRPRSDLISYGIYIGKDKELNTPIFWNIYESLNPHALIVGPTGSGKTELLLALALRIHNIYNVPVVFIDVKGDILSRLRNREFNFKVIRPGYDPLGLLYPFHVLPKQRALQLADAITQCWYIGHNHKTLSLLYEVLKLSFELCPYPSWDDLITLTRSKAKSHIEASIIQRIFEELEIIDPYGNSSHPLMKLKNEIIVFDLRPIPKERAEILNLISLMTFQDLINKVSALKPDYKQVVRAVIAIDEIWLALRSIKHSDLTLSLLRLSRGYGVSVIMATQSFRDLGDNWSLYAENVALLAALSSTSKKFWYEVAEYMKLNKEDVEKFTTLMTRGDAVVRILPDPRPILVSVDISDIVQLSKLFE